MKNNAVDYSGTAKVFVNGIPAVFAGTTSYRNYILRDTVLYSFKVDPTVLDNSVMVELTTTDDSKPYTVIYAELEVK